VHKPDRDNVWSNITQKKISITDANHIEYSISTLLKSLSGMKEIKQHIWVELHLQLKPVKIDIGEQAHVATLNSKTHTQSSNT
jgi:hypothetical protein